MRDRHIRPQEPRASRSLSSGAHSRDPLAHPGYGTYRSVYPAYLSGIVNGIWPVSTTKTASNLAGSVVLAFALTW